MRSTLTLALLLAAASAFAGEHHRDHINCGTCVTPLVDDVTDCNDFRVVFDDRDAVRAEETIPVVDGRSLVIRAPRNGGIYVHRTDAPRFAVTACKGAELGESLGQIRVSVNGDNVTAAGPRGDRWLVYFLVDMPRGAKGDFATSNGPIEIHGVDGSVVARAENGPLSATAASGSIDLKALNGPVAFRGSSGDVVLRTENGPISVDLRDTFWQHGTLDARTDNGPLSLRVPRGYRSGVTVDSDGRSPVSCHAEDCRSGRVKFVDDDSRWPSHIELGSGAVAVTLATHNGPVTVDER